MSRLLAIITVLAISACSEPNEEFTLAGRIVFSVDTGAYPILHMRPDGTDRQAVPVAALRPVQFLDVSPDGRRIVFQGRGTGGNPDIYVVNADGSDLRNLTSAAALDQHPVWSPDGSRIAFASSRSFDGETDVFIMSANGTNITNVTDNDGFDLWPDWDPDGQSISFTSDRAEAGNYDIYIVNLASANVTRLTDDPEDDAAARFDPAGQLLVFSSGRNVGAELFLMNTDGSDQRPLTSSNPSFGDFATWSPDASRIAVEVIPNIVVVDLGNGTAIDLGQGSYPTWGPQQ